MKKDSLALHGGSPVRAKSKYLVFGQPFIGEEEKIAVSKVLDSKWIGTGPRLKEFQDIFANYVGAKYALGVSSCTSALHLSLIAAGVGQGDEVITTPLTFAATANAIMHVGARPVFVDCEFSSQNIDPKKIEKKITGKTKAIIPVHFAGYPCDLDAIHEIADKYKLTVIEDAAHAIGTSYKNRRVGALSALTAFSFYATKNITTIEGGMITTNSEELFKKVSVYSNHGLSKDAWKRFSDEGYKHYQVEVPGYKYNMTDVQAVIGIEQMKKFEVMQARRKVIWNKYIAELTDLPLTLPSQPKEGQHAYHLFTVQLQLDALSASRDEVQSALHAEGIGTGIHYLAVHLHQFYVDTFKHAPTEFPVAYDISMRTLSLPLSPSLSNQDIADVVSAVRKVLSVFKK